MLIDRIVRFVLPRQDHFFTLLEQIAERMTASAAIFSELSVAASHEQFANISLRLSPIEAEADQLCHRMFDELDKTFVTPIDREDLASLTKALDDVIDGMEDSAAFAALFRFDALTDPMRQLVRIMAATAGELARAVGQLRKFSEPESIHAMAVAVHTLENEADIVYRRAIEELFGNGATARELVRQKDMLYSLEAGIDECEDAMDVIRSVVVKNG